MDEKRKKRIFFCIHLIAAFLFALYLIFSNQIMVRLDRSLNYIEKMSTSEIQKIANTLDGDTLKGKEDFQITAKAGAKIYHGLNLNLKEPSGDAMESVTITGFAACAAGNNNDDRHVDVILIGEENLYRIRAVLEWSGDNGAYAKYGIQGNTNHFIATFSTITLPEGRYRVGLYVWENENVCGYVCTSSIGEKTASGFQWYQPTALEDQSSEILCHAFSGDTLYVTVKNTGKSTWSSKDQIRCYLSVNKGDSYLRAELDPFQTVKAGEIAVFSFEDLNMDDFSEQVVEAQMLQEGVAYFGEREIVWNEQYAPKALSDYQSQIISYQFSNNDLLVRVKNTSTVNWTFKNFIRCYLRVNDVDTGIRAYLSPDKDVGPEEDVVFCFTDLKQKDLSKDHVVIQMVHEGITYFGDTLEIRWPAA